MSLFVSSTVSAASVLLGISALSHAPRPVEPGPALLCVQAESEPAGSIDVERAEPERELVREVLADGGRAEREVLLDATGARVADGSYRRWRADGSLAETGQFERGSKSGEWRSYHASGPVESSGEYLDGEREGPWLFLYQSGQRSAKGDYSLGARNSRWFFWDAAGEIIKHDSGTYIAEIEYHPNGRIAMIGEKLRDERHGRWRWWTSEGQLLCEAEFDKGRRHGSWRSFWPWSGSLQVAGSYLDGARVGGWTFRHLDGSFDARMLSGQFDRGRRLGNVSTPEAGDGARRRNFGLPLPLCLLPVPSPALGTMITDRLRLESLVESFRDVTPEQREARSESLVLRRQEAVPAILATLRLLDLTAPDDASYAEFLADVLARIHAGHSFGWRSGATHDDALHNQNQILRWISLWEFTRSAPGYLNDLADSPVGHLPSASLLQPPIPEPERLIDAAPSFGLRVSATARARRLAEGGGQGTEASLAAALEWLVGAQSSDGSWASAPQHPQFGVALTGLAALALVGGGQAEPGTPHAQQLRAAIDWLAQLGAPQGRFGDEPLGQALATAAVAEYVLASGDTARRALVEQGLERLVEAQGSETPGLWSSDTEPGPGDTLLTCWSLEALHAGQRAGFALPEGVARSALVALTELTDPLTGELAGPPTRAAAGQAGSDAVRDAADSSPSGQAASSPPGAADLGVLLARFQLGQSPDEVPLMVLAIERGRQHPPAADAALADAQAWYFGAGAFYQVGGSAWRKWAQGLRNGVCALQAREAGAPEAGSWAPEGFWGQVGGRTATTALSALALESYYRMPRIPR